LAWGKWDSYAILVVAVKSFIINKKIMSDRKMADCRKFPSESNCQMVMIGPEEDLLDASVDHAVSKHGHKKTPVLREELRKALEDAPQGV